MRLSGKSIALVAVLAMAFASYAPAEAGGVLLAEDGAPRAVLVLPAGAGGVERSAADLLQHFVKQMSGAELPVHRAEEGAMWHQVELAHEGMNFVLVGADELAGQLGIEKGDIGPGGFRIKTFANGVALLGGPERVEGEAGSDDGGVRHAAIEVLERLGCRYLWPGELGMVVPEKPTVAFGPLDYSYTPPVRRRGIRIRLGRHFRARFAEPLERLGLTREQWLEAEARDLGDEPPVGWSTWQRLGGHLPNFGHAGAGLSQAMRRAGQDVEWFMREHPEWFALQRDGTRDQHTTSRWRLCKSNPELIEFVANAIIEHRNEDPGLELVSLCPNDGSGVTGFCECEDCRALDPPHAPQVQTLVFPERERSGRTRRREMIPSLTDRMVHYWNSIAERVAEEHPDMLFGVSAYSRFSHPPVERELHPNLVIRYVPPDTERWQGWHEAGARRVFWRPNYLITGWTDSKLRVYVSEFAERIRYFADAGMNQTDINTIRHWWSVTGLNYYAAARLVWDPYLDPDEIIADYAKHGFGEGAEHVERYFHRAQELTEKGIRRTFSEADDYRYTPEVVAELRELLNQADRAADDEDVARRIEFLRVGLNFTELQERLTWKSHLAGQGEPYDRDLARRLVDLNCLVARDIPLNHPNTVHVVYQIGRTANFAHFSPVGGRTLEPSDPDLLERVEDPEYGWTGREQSLEEMLAAFGL